LTAAAGGAVLFFYSTRQVLAPFLLAAVIAYLLTPLVRLFERREIPRPIAILLVYIIFGIVVGIFLYLVIPALISELQAILFILPETAAAVEDFINKWLGRLLIHLPGNAFLQDLAADAVRRGSSLLQEAALRTLNAMLSFFSRAFSLFLAPFLAYYMLRDREHLAEALVNLLPVRKRPSFHRFLADLNKAVSRFLRGQVIVSAFVGVFITIGLVILRVDYAFLIGVFAGVTDVIPYFGPIISGVPAVLLGLLKGPVKALWVLLLFLLAHQLEGALLQPRIIGSNVGLHPLTVVFAVLAGGRLMGVWGMLLAVPAAAALKVTGNYIMDSLTAAAPEEGETGTADEISLR